MSSTRTILIPSTCSTRRRLRLLYIRPAVRLEIGPLASWVPSSVHGIKVYAAQAFPRAFSNPVFEVVAIDAERT
jgi:hypothetical protein